jgi:GMP synthase-like glutamine amidotransferase
MRAHYLQHVPFEGLGNIESWLQQKGYQITSTQFFNTSELPKPDEIGFLIIMGGPMSVNDEDKYPWLGDEKKFIHNTILAGIPTLGICLGAQLIADVMGGHITACNNKEIGWFPISAHKAPGKEAFSFPKELSVFHWHGETFSLPPGAVKIARNETCENQAFQLGKSVIGLQFHLEMTPISVKEIISNCRDELTVEAYVQEEDTILSFAEEHYQETNKWMENILNYLHQF